METPTSLAENAGPAIMKVLCVTSQSRTFRGTAFAVSDHIVLTSSHVVQPAANSVLDGGHLGDIGRLEWSMHEELDVALGITDEGTFRHWLTPACVDAAKFPTPVICVGYGSEGRGLECWTDNVSSYIRTHGLVSLQNTLLKGCSGGPVLDAAGRPVAIIVARHHDGSLKYVLPVCLFYAWMQRLGFRPMVMTHHGRVRSWLLQVPIGPHVPLDHVPPAVIEAFATTLHSETPARSHVAAANALVLANNPEDLSRRQITLPRGAQPVFDVPWHFWSRVFETFGTLSRRSVAALLEAHSAPNLSAQEEIVRRAFAKFRKYLMTSD